METDLNEKPAVILGDRTPKAKEPDDRTTFDDLLRHSLDRKPEALALADPLNRAAVTKGAPRRLSYADTDRIVTAIADRLARLGLKPDTVIGVMLPNTVESVLALLGIVRAGMIAAPLPLLWRRAEAVAALDRVGAKAIVTTGRVDGFDLCGFAMAVAAEIFPIRYVCSFGSGLPDGVIPLDDLFTAPPVAEPASPQRDSNPALHTALVTWDVSPGGTVAVARNQSEIIAGGLAALLEGGIAPSASILGYCAGSSFAGIALTTIPWLLSGGILSLHHGFDPDAFGSQSLTGDHGVVIVPGPIVPQLAAAGLLNNPNLQTVLALWRTPERLAIGLPWHGSAALTDVLAFGEIALLASRRGADGLPEPVPATTIVAPRGSAQGLRVAEIGRTHTGTLALRGPMVPRHAFPPGAERLPFPYFRTDAQGFADTGYPCRHDAESDSLVLTGPPPGTVSVGGYRFFMAELETLVREAGGDASITALPDALAGHRLAGVASDADAMRATLDARGASPLVSDAFRDWSKRTAA